MVGNDDVEILAAVHAEQHRVVALFLLNGRVDDAVEHIAVFDIKDRPVGGGIEHIVEHCPHLVHQLDLVEGFGLDGYLLHGIVRRRRDIHVFLIRKGIDEALSVEATPEVYFLAYAIRSLLRWLHLEGKLPRVPVIKEDVVAALLGVLHREVFRTVFVPIEGIHIRVVARLRVDGERHDFVCLFKATIVVGFLLAVRAGEGGDERQKP